MTVRGTSHRECLVPQRVEVIVDDPRLEYAGGAERARHEGVRLVLAHQVEEAPVDKDVVQFPA